MFKPVFLIAAISLAATSALAQRAAPALSAECRTEIQKLCAGSGDREAFRGCLREKFSSVSETCRTQLRAAMQARRGAGQTTPTPAPVE